MPKWNKQISRFEWQVPGRAIFTLTFRDWFKETIWCYLVLKLWPLATDFGSDPLKALYLEDEQQFLNQYRWRIREMNGLPRLNAPEEGKK